MTKTERELLDKCVEHYMANCEWTRIEEQSGEQFPGQLRQISQSLSMIQMDIDMLSGQLAEEREA